MSRSGYSDDDDGDGRIAMWRGQVASASRGKRGQQFFRDLVAALDAMPEKGLITHELRSPSGEVCAIGALGVNSGVDMSKLDPDEPDEVAAAFGIASCLAQEVVYMNDERFDWYYPGNGMKRAEYTPEERWLKMRDWAAKQIRVTPEEAGAVEVTESPDNQFPNSKDQP